MLDSEISAFEKTVHKRITELAAKLESIPFTSNDRYYGRKYEEYLEQFSLAMVPRSVSHSVAPENQSYIGSNISQPPTPAMLPRAVCPVPPRQTHQREMILMAKAEAYFRVAYKVCCVL